MAGLEPLQRIIYHEKQASGSMLCAQHALNALLQGNYFSAPDLSSIAANLDQLEDAHMEGRDSTSANMDDTGFFSVQVMEQALNVWGLRIPRWRSEEMKPFHEHPQTQLAFILNYEQHWYTLRRFGDMNSNPRLDQGQGHWFNLNSALDRPEWISKLYLGMVIQQAEADGYSVFVVTPIDTSEPLALPRTDADEVAATLPEPSSSGAASRLPGTSASGGAPMEGIEGFEDEDMELQRALQASLAGSTSDHLLIPEPAPTQTYAGASSASRPLSPLTFPGGMPVDEPSPIPDDLDPVAASRERNRRMLERMRAEQQWASQSIPREEDTAAAQRRRQREEEEEEMLRLAIAESEAMAAAAGTSSGTTKSTPEGEDSDTDTDIEIQPESHPPEPNHRRLVPLPTTSYSHLNRVYDDDDAELQAALRASLEHMPEGYVAPELPNAQSPPRSRPIPESELPLPPRFAAAVAAQQAKSEGATSASVNQQPEDEEEAASQSSPPPEPVSMDEIRRRRLARFGG